MSGSCHRHGKVGLLGLLELLEQRPQAEASARRLGALVTLYGGDR
jgi:hypothetical protein